MNNSVDWTVELQLNEMDIQALANSVEPDQMPQNMMSNQGLHCLPLIQQFLNPSTGSKKDLFKF